MDTTNQHPCRRCGIYMQAGIPAGAVCTDCARRVALESVLERSARIAAAVAVGSIPQARATL